MGNVLFVLIGHAGVTGVCKMTGAPRDKRVFYLWPAIWVSEFRHAEFRHPEFATPRNSPAA